MEKSPLPVFLLSVLMILAISPAAESSGGGGDVLVGWLTSAGTGRCEGGGGGTIGECLAGGGEFEMGSEINRRILATTNYISYQSLKADSTPSCGSGYSYYDNKCQSNQVNPYNRPCAKQAGCRG